MSWMRNCIRRDMGSRQYTGLPMLVLGALVVAAHALPKEISSNRGCKAAGILDTAPYRQQVPVPGTSHFLPVYSSVDLTQPLTVSNLLITLHGIGGNANTYFCTAVSNVPKTIGVIAPWFGTEAVNLPTWIGPAAAAGRNTSSLHWKRGKFGGGDAALNAPEISSFAALDALLDLLLTMNSNQGLAAHSNSTLASTLSGKASQLQQVVLVGFSAGGQTVHRYAWATSYGTPPPPLIGRSSSSSSSSSSTGGAWATSYGTPPPAAGAPFNGVGSSSSSSGSGRSGTSSSDGGTSSTSDSSSSSGGGGPKVKFVVSGPSSYLYFDAKRPAPSCRPLNDTGPKWRCKEFVAYTPTTAGCPGFDNYKLGTEGVLQATPYFTQQRPGVTPSQLSAAYLSKDILYVLGKTDTCNCGTKGYHNPQQCTRPPGNPSKGCAPSVVGPQCCDAPAPSRTNTLALSCGAMMQGSNRLQRGLLYLDYLRHWSGGTRKPRVTTVPNMGHSAPLMFTSPTFLRFIGA